MFDLAVWNDFFCKETGHMTEGSTIYALLLFGAGMRQLSIFSPSALSAGWLSPVIQFQALGKVCCQSVV